MSFDSISFAYFLFLLLALYYTLPARFRLGLILLASVLFYVWVNTLTVFIPLLIVLISYYAAINIEKKVGRNTKTKLLPLSIVAIVGILVFYKYAGLLLRVVTDSADSFFESLVIPLGISYISFQAIGYLIDVSRGSLAAEKEFKNFAGYLLFFPKLIAGPVENAKHFLPQLKRPISFNYDGITAGMKQFAWGLFKKLAIANRLGVFVDSVYGNPYQDHGPGLLLAVVLFSFQLYADFSGYTDMALGIARMLGYELSPNFNLPFSAKSITEFWRRWHISLSAWFNNYFYTPIAVRMRDLGRSGIVFAGIFSFLVLGLWHGPNWTFVIFGGIQGVAIAIEFLTTKSRKHVKQKMPSGLNTILSITGTFCFFSFSCIFFRSDTVDSAFYIFAHLFSGITHWSSVSTISSYLQGHGWALSDYLFIAISVLAMLMIEKKDAIARVAQLPLAARWSVYYLFVLVLVVYGMPSQSTFIYKQF